jgi:hypothetical protein
MAALKRIEFSAPGHQRPQYGRIDREIEHDQPSPVGGQENGRGRHDRRLSEVEVKFPP